MRHPFLTVVLAVPIAVLAAGAAGAVNTPGQGQTEGLGGVYSFVGALEGDATLFAARSGARSELELHLPILRGDRVWTTPGARLAVLMSDRSILALDYDTEVTLERIAGSPDGEDRDSLYVLHRGRLSLEVEDRLLDAELPAVDTANARIYMKQGGRYQVHSDGDRWTEVTVLTGFTEVVTQRGSVIVRGGETLVANGLDNPWIELQSGAAAAAAMLDDWTAGHRARLVAYAGVDAGAYGNALDAHGDWVEVDDRRAWKPRVAGDWQPYSRGRWTDTPAGLYWVARDPWGPLPYHYGSWSMHPAWGWLWYPGLVYAPSHVYWYWGPSYVGWIPSGYYRHYYRGLGFGLRFGLYGWAGGLWDPFNSWIFCPSGYLGYGRGYTYGRSLRRHHPKLERGLITTDTRGIDRRNWHDPTRAQRALLGRRSGLAGSELPDVDSFVARGGDLDPAVRTRIVRSKQDPPAVSVRRVPVPGSGAGATSVTAGGVRAKPSSPASASAGGIRAAPSGPTRATAGGIRAAPSSPAGRADVVRDGGAGIRRAGRAPATRDEDGDTATGTTVTRTVPSSPGAAPAPSRRPTPGRRVLDAIRSRDGAATPTRVRSAPRTSTPKAAPPTRVRSTTPRTVTPGSAPPTRVRSTPRTSTPRSAPPTRVRSTPRATTPRSAPPTRVRSTPRTSTPKAAPPTRIRSVPRSSTPRATPTRVRSTPRSSSPRSSSPRSSSAPRSYSPPPSSSPSSYSPPPSSSPSSSSPPPSSPPSGGGGQTPPFGF